MSHNGKKGLAVLLLVSLLAGCGKSDLTPSSEEMAQDPEIVTWFTGDTVPIQYKIPKTRPYIVVDQIGYLPSSIKKCFCQDIVEETVFEVIDQKTGKSVYQGVLKATEDELTYLGDFSQVNKPGTYYIKTDYLGESYPFEISDQAYNNQIDGLLESIGEMDWTKDIRESCMVIDTLMLAFELYPEVFVSEKAKELPKVLLLCQDGIQQILTFQNHKNGAVFEKVVEDKGDYKDGDRNLTAFFVGTVAKYCYSLKEYDARKATELLQYASLGWQYMNKDIDSIDLDHFFFACSEMYRVTGQSKYRYALQDKLPTKERITSGGEYDLAYFGNITYLCTSYKVELDYCNLAIDSMIREATEITEESKEETYFVRDDTTEYAILKDASTIVFASRVNYNQEYMTVLENHVHFLTGMNLENFNYFEQLNSWINTSDYGKSMAILAYSLLIERI